MISSGIPARLSASPNQLQKSGGVLEGSAIEIIPQGEQNVFRRKSRDLKHLLAQITAEALNSKHDFGPPQGNEA